MFRWVCAGNQGSKDVDRAGIMLDFGLGKEDWEEVRTEFSLAVKGGKRSEGS